jgi:vacuolar-type H+-ATPase subunit F/Vma7
MMRGDVRVIARPEVALGFALAGVPVLELPVDRDAGAAVAAIARDTAHVLLLVEDSLLRLLSDVDRAELAKRPVPILVPFPTPTWEDQIEEPGEYILALLQRAIGYRVRLQ